MDFLSYSYKNKKMNYIKDKNTREDKKIAIALMSSFAILTIQYLILVVFNLIDTRTGEMVKLTSKVIVGFFYLSALPTVLKRNKIKFIGIYFIAIFLFVFNYTFFNENWIYLKSVIFLLFFTCLPSFIYAYSLNDWDVLMENMKKTSNIVFAIGAIIGILVFIGNSSIGSYSMSLSYYMLLPAIIYMNEFLDRISFKNGLLLGVSILVILALGSRGAVMCIGAFSILKFARQLKIITYKKILLYVILFVLIISVLIYLDKILEYLYDFLLGFGISSRTIRLFLHDGVYLSGRDMLYENVINETIQKPFLGIGIAGDRRIINTYSHNILIEILSQFGIVVGTILITGLGYLVLKSLFTKDLKKYNILIIWLSIGLIHLLVSGSYLIDFKFWIILGLMIKNLKNNSFVDNIK